jgi:hypothetical protein
VAQLRATTLSRRCTNAKRDQVRAISPSRKNHGQISCVNSTFVSNIGVSVSVSETKSATRPPTVYASLLVRSASSTLRDTADVAGAGGARARRAPAPGPAPGPAPARRRVFGTLSATCPIGSPPRSLPHLALEACGTLHGHFGCLSRAANAGSAVGRATAQITRHVMIDDCAPSLS